MLEGTIGVDRIISMLNVHHDQLVVEEKGIYSIESFLNARRLMYWQVYLHKTAISAERMLVNLVERAQALVHAGESVPASAALMTLLANQFSLDEMKNDPLKLQAFAELDDNDIWGAIKFWKHHPDMILSTLAAMILERRLFQINLGSAPVNKQSLDDIRTRVVDTFDVLRAEAKYLFGHGTVSNEAYTEGQTINVLTKRGELLDVAQASDLPNIKAISKIVKKNYLCWPKNVSLSG